MNSINSTIDLMFPCIKVIKHFNKMNKNNAEMEMVEKGRNKIFFSVNKAYMYFTLPAYLSQSALSVDWCEALVGWLKESCFYSFSTITIHKFSFISLKCFYYLQLLYSSFLMKMLIWLQLAMAFRSALRQCCITVPQFGTCSHWLNVNVCC